ncbi:MAG: VOC family protein [Pirellulales bacterium]
MPTINLQPIPYLSFDGKCREAMNFYAKTFGGTIRLMMSGADSPVACQMPPEFADRILNAQLELPGGAMLYGGDAPAHMPYEGIKGITIALNYSSVDEAEAVFKAISEGGTVTMPYSPTFWAKKFGMATDRFGIHWIINGELTPLT